MAIVQNPITGRSSGTYAGAVFATQFGKNVLRSKPVSVSVSQSAASKLAREKFKKLAQAVRDLLPALNVFFTSKQFNMPIMSYIIGQCYDQALTGELGFVNVLYQKIIPAPDSLGLGEYISATKQSGEVTVTLNGTSIKNIIGADNKLNIAVYNVKTGKLISVLQDQEPDLASKTFTSALIGSTDTIHVYVKPKKKVQFKPGSDLCVTVA